jgi:hypothetical protein
MNYKNQTTTGNKPYHLRKRIITVAVAVVAVMLAVTPSVNAKPSADCNWYLSAGAQGIVDARGTGPDANLGGGVVVNGSSDYSGRHALNVGVGREFTVCNDTGRRTHLRLEAQYWDGYVHRNSVALGVVNPVLDDKVDYRALFLNGFVALSRTDKFSLWLGPGVGYAWTSFPDASYATPCGCLKAAKSEGLALQLKLQAERRVYDNTSVFGEVGYVNFPGAQSTGIPGSSYGDVGMVIIGLGVITHL